MWRYLKQIEWTLEVVNFLDVEVPRESGRFKITVYWKPTLSSVYTHFGRFLPATYKFSMIYTLAFRYFKIFPNWTLVHNGLQQLKDIFCNICILKIS